MVPFMAFWLTRIPPLPQTHACVANSICFYIDHVAARKFPNSFKKISQYRLKTDSDHHSVL
ncbi:hypothetical protein GZ78_10185 [Endozoicomonas numazuensis]|uniref:Uncharacterized protein n=1 Tax=Endozoicomonas numazuensis TaxID=1137799 RepID=A0A081NHP9_9GAMM|nr:hypothetical protein GZ78_10185 [Endozoicomonas numazuensis]